MPKHAHFISGLINVELNVVQGVVNHVPQPVELINNPVDDWEDDVVIDNLHPIPHQLPASF